MATVLLSAVGASIGGGFGGAFLGLSGAVIGRAVGATLGRAIDQRLLGGGSRAVETGRIDRLRLQTAGEGVPIPRIWGQMRLPGHAIWASPLLETRQTQGSGKGSPQPQVTEISYLLSIALSLCEGRILGVGRVWADGEEISRDDLQMRVYPGDEKQLPDPVIAAFEGEDAPAYRGLAYVVIENLSLERWGNRMPQLQFEVTRAAQDGSGLCGDVRAIAMIPGTGEYALATTPVIQDFGLGSTRSINQNTAVKGTDFQASLDILGRELPRVESVSLIVSWFGDDLRIGNCRLKPKVESRADGFKGMEWASGGINRAQADEVVRKDGRPIYGGTPADRSVIEAIRAARASGRRAMFYPFILMEQLQGNGLPDPYGASEQPIMPWRGRITTSVAAGRSGSNNGTNQARVDVETFFGAASGRDFQISGQNVGYCGPEEWSYRRFILHYAHLCAAAGGVDSFLIGSEMVGMTRIRDASGNYPAVDALKKLAADCREILGSHTKIGYAADWSEYYGDHRSNGEVRFHLDPLWADANIDFIGIDNYMPLSDWRDGEDHLDAHWGHNEDHDYLVANVAGGEGYDWYYASDDDRRAQRRTPIIDGEHGEHWIWRYKDLKGWWENTHHERIDGIRKDRPTEWVPGSKPIWFTEYGCAAMDKAANQPNKFLDALSSESALPWFSSGRRNDSLQASYIRATMAYWSSSENNPRSMSGVRMVDVANAHVWCWDARPFPAFPARTDIWSDGPAWERGHWLNGRASAVALAAVVADICRDAGLDEVDVDGLHGVVRGYALTGGETGRAALQPLMLAYGFDAVESGGRLAFVMRDGLARVDLDDSHLAVGDEVSGLELSRAPDAEMAGRVLLTHIEAGGDYAVTTAESMLPDAALSATSESEFPLAMTRTEGRQVAERWLTEALVARDNARFCLPPSFGHLRPCDIIRWTDARGGGQRWRIDRIEHAGAITIDAVRVDSNAYRAKVSFESGVAPYSYAAPLPVWPMIMDLPLIKGDEAPHAPHVAVTASPWKGAAAVYVSADENGGYDLDQTILRRSIMGVTLEPLPAARPGVMDRGRPLRIKLRGGTLKSVTQASLLGGANAVAIGDGTAQNWEIIQFAAARLVAPEEWEISGRLRGQAGTEAVMPAVWPAGSVVVLLDGSPKQTHLAPSTRGQIRHWRIGPAARTPDDPSYRSMETVIAGVGFRPYAPCHLRLAGDKLSWVRRTRIDGDGWEGIDVPLGETREAYHVRLLRNGQVLKDVVVNQPEYVVPQSILAGGPFVAEVAQLSDQVGAGPFVRRELHVVQ